MIEPELPRMKRNRSQPLVLKLLAERSRRTVLDVTDDRMPARCALNPNLVRASGFELDF